MPGQPIIQGFDPNFFTKIVVTRNNFGPTADAIIQMRGGLKNLLLINEGTDIIEYSFNGNTLHGDMIPGTASAALAFDNRPISKIWFRVISGSSKVRVEAWS